MEVQGVCDCGHGVRRWAARVRRPGIGEEQEINRARYGIDWTVKSGRKRGLCGQELSFGS